MKKFILLLLVPFLLVMSTFAAEFELDEDDYYLEVETDYEKDDITLEIEDLGLDDDGDFHFNLYIVNDSKNKLILDCGESGLAIFDEDFEIIDETFALFSEEGDAVVIKARSDDFYLPNLVLFGEDSLDSVGGVATMYYIEMEIKGKVYYWAITGFAY